jgi:hypothetical protein
MSLSMLYLTGPRAFSSLAYNLVALILILLLGKPIVILAVKWHGTVGSPKGSRAVPLH